MIADFVERFATGRFRQRTESCRDGSWVPPRYSGGRFANWLPRWHRGNVNALRELRRNANLSQRELARLLDVPTNTFRMWDSGMRAMPLNLLERAKRVVARRIRNTELVSFDQLACELGVHQRTLRAAARTGHLAVHLSSRSAFGRSIRFATREAGNAFMRDYYRNFAGHGAAVVPLSTVPADYDVQLKRLRHRLRLTQAGFARQVGAANKAVIYQWESRKRTPSAWFWKRVHRLIAGRRRARSKNPRRAEAIA